MADAFGRAIRDFHQDGLDEPLVQRDGEETLDHPIEEFYFGSFDAEGEEGAWIEAQVDGPLLDIGAGAGRGSPIVDLSTNKIGGYNRKLVDAFEARFGTRDPSVVLDRDGEAAD